MKSFIVDIYTYIARVKGGLAYLMLDLCLYLEFIPSNEKSDNHTYLLSFKVISTLDMNCYKYGKVNVLIMHICLFKCNRYRHI